tara:strand:- start:257 stop:820 length:564 start_codon:yes stop_codon:yes gene_type:complete
MSQSKVIIINLKGLYNILLELKEFLKFELIYYESEKNLVKKTVENNHLIISNKKILDIDTKSLLILVEAPIKILDLIEKININLLKQKYSSQSNFEIKEYKLDLNSRIMSFQKKELKLTEREIEIILFLNKKKIPQSIDILQKEVWGYSDNLETHTVETHVYRLRKKIKETFKDNNFLVSSKDGYKI